ncbi:hypothetical protein [Roseivirga sp.]|uniref:hypothetical protein n=1 Tax=Roseivirga sp. TaxID=1964215 RepID=UPI003B52871C
MKLKYIRNAALFFSALVLSLQAQAQNGSGGVTSGGSAGTQLSGEVSINLRGNGAGKSFIRSHLPVEDVTDYQPFLYEKARKANITLLSGATREGYFLYNLETETLQNVETDEIIPWNIVKQFTFEPVDDMEEVSFSNMQLVWPEAGLGGFIQNVKSSPFVKVKHYLEFIPKSYDLSTGMGDKNNKIEAFSDAYLKLDDKWVELPNGKTAFFDLFGVYSEEMRKYARKNKLKPNRPEDAGELVNWVLKNGN